MRAVRRRTAPSARFLDEETDDILIGGHAMGATRKFRNVKANGQVAVVVDDLASRDPWTVRGLEIRGTAVALEDVDPPVPSMRREVIRITPSWLASWGIDPAAPRHADPPVLTPSRRCGLCLTPYPLLERRDPMTCVGVLKIRKPPVVAGDNPSAERGGTGAPMENPGAPDWVP